MLHTVTTIHSIKDGGLTFGAAIAALNISGADGSLRLTEPSRRQNFRSVAAAATGMRKRDVAGASDLAPLRRQVQCATGR
jgi:hypothetical protein